MAEPTKPKRMALRRSDPNYYRPDFWSRKELGLKEGGGAVNPANAFSKTMQALTGGLWPHLPSKMGQGQASSSTKVPKPKGTR
jgi:hypothetical protein